MEGPSLMIAIALASAAAAAAAPPAPRYAVTGTIAGPDAGGWDYARVDPARRRLYVARQTSVTVIDIASGKALTSIGAPARGHAVVPLADGRLLVTSGNDATVRFLDAAGAEVANLPVGKKPDAAILEPDGRTAYVMNADAGSVAVIDTAAMRIVRTIAVKPALEYGALDGRGALFVNDEAANEIEVVDLASDTVRGAIPLPGCKAPSGLAYDRRTDRLVSACANGKAAVVDARRRRLVSLVDIGRGPDAVILDEARRLAFVPCGRDGVLEILALDGPAVRRVGRVVTEPGARTGALDPASGAVYLPTARLVPAAGGRRPAAAPGTFHVLVVRPG